MTKLNILPLLIFSFNLVAMKQAKEFASEGVITLLVHGKDNTIQEIRKKVEMVTPTPMSKAKAETYFRKKTKALNLTMKSLVDLTVSLMKNNEVGRVEYAQDPNDAHWNNDIFSLLVHPGSKFIYKAETSSIFLERYLGGDKNNWYFTELLEVIRDDNLAHKGVCSPITVQCHHDKAGVHDKIWVSELEKNYEESGMPKLIIATDDVPTVREQLEKEGKILMVLNSDERLCKMATVFVTMYPKYKHISTKK